MGKKRVVRKKVVRQKSEPGLKAPGSRVEEVQASKFTREVVAPGDAMELLHNHLGRSLRWLDFAMVLQFTGAALVLILAGWAGMSMRSGGEAVGLSGQDLMGGMTALAGAVTTVLLLTLGVRTLRMRQAITGWEASPTEAAMENLLWRMVGVWKLVAGCFLLAGVTVGMFVWGSL